MFVAGGAQVSQNSRGPLGVVDPEYVEQEGDQVGGWGSGRGRVCVGGGEQGGGMG